MITLVTILLVLAMLGTLGVLLAGVVGLVRSPEVPDSRRAARSNALMRWRVMLQGLALGLFALLVLLMRSQG
ncbi:twin transmembrane helix small protein [Roseomonas sp. OT10]|uniref:twin transmembrane helix small protein n=1 Tax=Roseomonas cutis TaxID=2897332 RepID=UPI001E6006ED|nr:twin transmembrane helix small protein [Roseomonas sp. OT10]UFN47793.1 twin transmembrane helix small protein [Roseomonas sp. OT10]